jgi:mannose-6-phosphate isomerase-like protein (cupin superfamily)
MPSPMLQPWFAAVSYVGNPGGIAHGGSRHRRTDGVEGKPGWALSISSADSGREAFMSLWNPQDVPPYPPTRYTKDQAEVSGWVRRGDTAPDYEAPGLVKNTYLANSVKYHYLADQEQTNGDYALYRVELGPNSGGPAPHFHRTMSEAFFLLSGTVKFYLGTEWTNHTQNDFLFVPPGGSHGWHNDSDEPASMLILFSPGAPRNHFFEGLAQLGELTAHERREWFARHDNVFIE